MIEKMCHVIYNYFVKDHPKGNRFYVEANNPYDGIHFGSDGIYDFVDSIIMKGKEWYYKFFNSPFDGDIMNYLERGVSCGNSSCLYFRPISDKNNTKPFQYKTNDEMVIFRWPVLVRVAVYYVMLYAIIMYGDFSAQKYYYFQF